MNGKLLSFISRHRGRVALYGLLLLVLAAGGLWLIYEKHPEADRDAEFNRYIEIERRLLHLVAEEKPAEAEPLHRALLPIAEHLWGPESRNVLMNCYNLSRCLEAQGKKAEALVFARRALEGLRKTLGETHPYTQIVKEQLEKFEQLR
jgi:hypothetical protein